MTAAHRAAAALLASAALALTGCGTDAPAPAPTSPAPASSSATSPSAAPSTAPAAGTTAPSSSAGTTPIPTPTPTSPAPTASEAPKAGAPSSSAAARTPRTSAGAGGTDCSAAACVALTFDDGPVRPTTVEVLDALAARDVPATFFVIGTLAEQEPELLRRMAAEGHEIGNHTHTHPDLTTLDRAEAVAELEAAQDAVEAATGERPTVARPPWGFHDADVDAAIEETVGTVLTWTADTEDWQSRSAAAVTDVEVSEGDVVLMHDIYPSTSGAVGALVDRLEAEGYTLVTVSDLLDG